MASTSSAPDVSAEIEKLRAELVELRQQQATGQATNTLLEQLVQKLDSGKVYIYGFGFCAISEAQTNRSEGRRDG